MTVNFLNPAFLGLLFFLPSIWILLKITPPAPKIINFPAVSFIKKLTTKKTASQNTPLLILIIRMIILSLIILALAHPVRQTSFNNMKADNIIIILQNSWKSAKNWNNKIKGIKNVLEVAKRSNANIFFISSTNKKNGDKPLFFNPTNFKKLKPKIDTLFPNAFEENTQFFEEKIKQVANNKSIKGKTISFVFPDNSLSKKLDKTINELKKLGSIYYMIDKEKKSSLKTIESYEKLNNKFLINIKRAKNYNKEEKGTLVLFDKKQQTISSQGFLFEKNKKHAKTLFELPNNLISQIFGIKVKGSNITAGEVAILGNELSQTNVGIISYKDEKNDIPLLSKSYYIKKAVYPTSKIYAQKLEKLLKEDLSIIIAPDGFESDEKTKNKLLEFIKNGGTFVQFAGEILANKVENNSIDYRFLPTKLRKGGRNIKGAISWQKPALISKIKKQSIFYGINIPKEPLIKTQVLASPSPDVFDKTIVSLEDDTPVVTYEKKGKGRLFLFHSSANTSWGKLPLSGMFVEMLERIILTSRVSNTSNIEDIKLSPFMELDGFGNLSYQLSNFSKPLSLNEFNDIKPSSLHPAGVYKNNKILKAINISLKKHNLASRKNAPTGTKEIDISNTQKEFDFAPLLFFLSLLFVLIEQILYLNVRGVFSFDWLKKLKLLKIALVLILIPNICFAKNIDYEKDVKKTIKNKIAFIKTKNETIDFIAKKAFSFLRKQLMLRTTVKLGKLEVVELKNSDLSLYPIVYWAISDIKEAPSKKDLKKLNEYMAKGGLLWIDTRDFHLKQSGENISTQSNLEFLAQALEIPRLAPIKNNHVLFRSFYLIDSCPGRMKGGDIWVSKNSFENKSFSTTGSKNDNVSPVVIGSNDWIGALARKDDNDDSPLLSVIGNQGQREKSLKCAINIVMYALTGNYKNDQIHLDIILDRLKQ